MVEYDKEIRKLNKGLLVVNIALTLALVTMAICCWKLGDDLSKLTQTTVKVAKQVNVDFQTRTNNLFWVQTVKPR